jgi:hypothetical protein
LKTFVESQRSEQQRTLPYEIKLGGRSRSPDWEQDRALMKALAEAGVTWWVDASSLAEMRLGVQRCPLRIE